MKLSCPHCAQRIDLDLESLNLLAGKQSFGCPACGGEVPLPQTRHDTGDSPSPADPRPAAHEIDEISRSFDSRYQIKRLIGRGGMGAVYEGFDTRLDRRVAIKILPAGSDSKPGALLRFEREAKAMAALDHPNIVHIHDYGKTPDGNPYFVMEFIDGMDVHHLRHSGQLDLPGALELVSQVCSALQYAHSRGIIHRDIKPGNILVTRDGVAKVADFGLAKVIGTEDQPHHDPTLTKSGAAVGTPDYMAPEQFEGSHVDHRADIYSLGVMLYDLLTGSPPRGAWPPPSQRVQIDVRLDEIVLRALQQNPSSRYQAASEVRADIDSVKSTTGGGPLPPGMDPTPLPSRIASSASLQAAPATSVDVRSVIVPTPARSNTAEDTAGGLTTTLLILGLLAIAIIGGLAFYLAHREPPETRSNQQLVENTTIHRDIPPGMTAEDLKDVGDIRSGPHGFIGISMEALDWDQAMALAKRTGAEVLTVDELDPAWSPLHEWLRGHFAAPLAMQAWVSNQGAPGLLASDKNTAPDSAATPAGKPRHKVLLQWQREKPIPSATSIESTPLPDPPPEEQPTAAPTPQAEVTIPAESPQPPAPPTGPLPWTNTDGKTIQAEFIRLDGQSVIIRKDGKQFTLPLSKLSPESRKQASECALAIESTGKPQNKAATTPNLDYGLLISYGMQTFTGRATEGEQSEKAAASRFAPANVDVKSWARLAKEGGMNFAVMSVKHSSGFRLWDAPYDDYDLGGSPFRRDLLAEFIESCNAEGLMPGANYIVTDVHREGAYRRAEPVSATHMKLVKQELGDLLTHYSGLRLLVFGHFGRFTPQEAAEIRTLVQTRNPKCVILDDGPPGQIYQPLSTVKGWFQAPPEAENPKAADLFGDIQKWRSDGVPVLLNVGPAQDGQIPYAQRDLVLKMKGFGVKSSTDQ